MFFLDFEWSITTFLAANTPITGYPKGTPDWLNQCVLIALFHYFPAIILLNKYFFPTLYLSSWDYDKKCWMWSWVWLNCEICENIPKSWWTDVDLFWLNLINVFILEPLMHLLWVSTDGTVHKNSNLIHLLQGVGKLRWMKYF